ncbi:MAG: metallophosphoesterase [Oscillospiraceae bacterium]|nr:metallophosphoesterase [Oscillospiraceae bacterium]
MIFITGDIHGDITRFRSPILRKLRKNDALIVCGDFGFIWDGSEKENKLLKRIGKLPYNVLFVEGSHENYDLLEDYPVEEWCGGKTRRISGRLRQLMRGQVYNIAEKVVFSFGGGQSDDTVDLIEGENWWKREIPSEHELEEGIRNLEKAGNKVDFMVTYEPPSKLHDFLDHTSGDRNHINTYLNEIYEKISFERWFFGKLHMNKLIPPKYYAVYDQIIVADETKIKKKRPQKRPKNKNQEEN